MIKLASLLISAALLCALAGGVFMPVEGLVTLSVAACWSLTALSIPVSLILICAASMYGPSTDEPLKTSLAKLLVNAAKKRSRIGKFLGRLQFVLTLALLGYAGWIFTAVTYFLASMVMRFAGSMARDAAVKSGLA
ncbi:hypothetical protein [Pantoea coffeiphila]|uniref:hypothetical protein n=1 Tax=Pantoea coffeiphila TaxID=1465635 RepID=UPI001960DAE8|nr:hypothetical protein [Pantoea coffeiphila]MBM7346070.1 hypothetical protein [Pantoea coffeiphila]